MLFKATVCGFCVCVCVSCCFINLLNLPDLISPGQTQPGDISLDKLIALIEQMDPWYKNFRPFIKAETERHIDETIQMAFYPQHQALRHISIEMAFISNMPYAS